MTREQEQAEKLREFVRYVIRNDCWDIGHFGGVLDGGSIQDKAEKLGIIVKSTVTGKDFEDGVVCDSEFDIGDPFYKFSDWME